MIEILEKPKEKLYTIRCDGCEALLKFSERGEQYQQGNLIQEPLSFIVCPNCTKKITTRTHGIAIRYNNYGEKFTTVVEPKDYRTPYTKDRK